MLRGSGALKSDDDGWEDFHRSVIIPALDISTAVRLSMTDYEFVLSTQHQRVVHVGEIQSYHMVDASSSKVIRPDSILKVGEEGRIGVDLLTVTPALMRTKHEGVQRVILAKPTILVKLDEPMGKRKALNKLANFSSWLTGGAPDAVD